MKKSPPLLLFIAKTAFPSQALDERIVMYDDIANPSSAPWGATEGGSETDTMAISKAGQSWEFTNCLLIVAHPDDEILWAGGLMLLHPQTRWTVLTLTRKSDPDRSAKFNRVMEFLGAKGIMGDLDDSPEQKPLTEKEVRKTIQAMMPMDKFDLILTHSRWGEYTRHIRHEEVSRAVLALHTTGELPSKLMWMFSYEDGGGKYLPKASRDADIQIWLPDPIWQEKYRIITEMYGFAADSFEAKCCPKQEGFWQFGTTVAPNRGEKK